MSAESLWVVDTRSSEGVLPDGVFSAVFRNHPAGVAVVAAGGSSPVGFTATSLVSVSKTPPLVSFNIARTASSWPAVESASHLAVHLLSHDQHELATTFATSGIDRFAATPGWRRGPYGLPVLPGVAAWLGTEVRQLVHAGDHAVVIAEIVQVHLGGQPVVGADAVPVTEAAPQAPLLYHAGRFARLAEGERDG